MKRTILPIILASLVAAHSTYSNEITQWPTTGLNARFYSINAEISGSSGFYHHRPIGSTGFYDSVEEFDAINRAFASVSMSVTSSPTSFTESSTVITEATYDQVALSYNNDGSGDGRWQLNIDTPSYITIDSVVNVSSYSFSGPSVNFLLQDATAPDGVYLFGYGSANGPPRTFGPQLLNPGLYYFSAAAWAGSGASASYSVTVAVTPVSQPPTLQISLTSSNYVRLYWAIQASGYSLQSSPDLLPDHFINTLAATMIEGAYQAVYLPMTNSQVLFRLAQ
jgi:hypothetical protein